MDLSIICPSIRKEKMKPFYESCVKAFSGNMEVLFIGPNNPGFDRKNMGWFEEFGTPTRAQQVGLIHAIGDWVCFAFDDGQFMEGSLDKTWDILRENKFNNKTVVCGKYTEGDQAPELMLSDKYYYINTHSGAISPHIPTDFKTCNLGIVSRETALEIGGFDCRFETTALSELDFAIRLQLYGCKVIIQPDCMMVATWLMGNEGDHGPINEAFERNDVNLYNKMYKNPEFNREIKIDIDNWKDSPTKWERRFGK